MRIKLHLIRYFYSMMTGYIADNKAFYQPMFFEFPHEPMAYSSSLENNVMLSTQLKLSMQSSHINKNVTEFWFPPGIWCDIFNDKGIDGCMNLTEGISMNMSTKAYEFYLHIREGSVVPMQDGTELAKNYKVSNTADL